MFRNAKFSSDFLTLMVLIGEGCWYALISKNTRNTSFLNLADKDPVIKVFQQMGQSVLDFADETSRTPGDV